uniref:TFCFD n=1 Tax=Arundo donax TaxID=35708 RepID=A0A0A9BJ31_ARUDO
MTGIHFNIMNLYGNIPRASAAPRLAATLGSSRSATYFEMISLAIFSPEETIYVGIKCFNASTAEHCI